MALRAARVREMGHGMTQTFVGPTLIVTGTYDGTTGLRNQKSWWHSLGWWQDHLVSVENEPDSPPCDEHQLEEIDHYGHPTNELWCLECAGFAWSPTPRVCEDADCWHHGDPEKWFAARGYTMPG